MGKITVIYTKFLLDVACQKLLKSANVSRSYSKNKSGFLFLEHGVVVVVVVVVVAVVVVDRYLLSVIKFVY